MLKKLFRYFVSELREAVFTENGVDYGDFEELVNAAQTFWIAVI